jgi:hypothetical protein
VCITQLSWSKEVLSPTLLSVLFKSLCDLLSVSLPLISWKYAPPKENDAKIQGKIMVNMTSQKRNVMPINWSDKVKIWDWCFEKLHVFSGRWVALWEKWINHAQYSAELYVSWAFMGTFFSTEVSLELYSHGYQKSNVIFHCEINNVGHCSRCYILRDMLKFFLNKYTYLLIISESSK